MSSRIVTWQLQKRRWANRRILEFDQSCGLESDVRKTQASANNDAYAFAAYLLILQDPST